MPGAKELDPGDSVEQYLGNVVREARLALGREWTQAYVGGRSSAAGAGSPRSSWVRTRRTATSPGSWRWSSGFRPEPS